jgi:hypothetical protein
MHGGGFADRGREKKRGPVCDSHVIEKQAAQEDPGSIRSSLSGPLEADVHQTPLERPLCAGEAVQAHWCALPLHTTRRK